MDDRYADGRGALTQLRAYLAQSDLPVNSRLPPERELVDLLGVSRGDLRKALDVLEREGELWRHVGKGTFVGAKPVDELSSLSAIAAKTNPSAVMRTRLLIEPVIAREAALNATADDIAEMRECQRGSREARTWRFYENWDNRLHRTIAQATHNVLLLAMFDTLNTVRRTVVWGQLRPANIRPAPDHHSYAEHEALVTAIENRNLQEAECAMRTHLIGVAKALLELDQAAE